MKYDVIVIGGGLAGLTSAIRCSEAGLKNRCCQCWRERPGFCIRFHRRTPAFKKIMRL